MAVDVIAMKPLSWKEPRIDLPAEAGIGERGRYAGNC